MNNGSIFKCIGISRLRIATDGDGVTTLVCGHGCPLSCRYCLNPQSRRDGTPVKTYTPEELYSKLERDSLYFAATGGGVCFGGGEPLLYSKFISDFYELCRGEWKLSIETSLHSDYENIARLEDKIDRWIIDIKDSNQAIYREYTGCDNCVTLANLQILVRQVGPERLKIRVPHIPGYNKKEDIEKTLVYLHTHGIYNTDIFEYKTNINK